MKVKSVYPTIPTSDITRSRQFYEGKLGWRARGEAPDGSVVLECGEGTICCLYSSEFAGTAKHTVVALSVEDFDNSMAQLRSKGVTFEDYDLPGLKTVKGVAKMDGERCAWFTDPEGNILGILTYVEQLAHV